MRGRLRHLWNVLYSLRTADRRLDEIKLNQGLLLAALNGAKTSTRLEDYEFKVFSQWGEDGIIQFLTSQLELDQRTFVELGVEDFFESNCRFLLMKDNWRGFVVDASHRQLRRLQSSYFYWRHPLRCRAAWLTRDNADALVAESGFDPRLGLLSLDVDGVDYHVLEALGRWQPAILIVEYNALFGCERAVSVPYDAGFVRGQRHSSNLYYGASLPAFAQLAGSRGYALVGVNSVGSNAFFVRRDRLAGRVREVALRDCFRDSSFRESRDRRGRLSFLEGDARRAAIAALPLVDVTTGEKLRVGDLPG